MKKNTCSGERTVCRAPRRPGSSDLGHLVEEYLLRFGDCYKEQDAWWGDRALTWEDALRRAWASRFCGGKMCSHQYRVAGRLAEGLAVSLSDRKGLGSFASFDDLHSWISSVSDRVRGIGHLTAYDVAQRLGARLGLQPTKVFLHAETAVGARKLGVRGSVAELSAFPPEVQKLGALHAENFLCIYADRLRSVQS